MPYQKVEKSTRETYTDNSGVAGGYTARLVSILTSLMKNCSRYIDMLITPARKVMVPKCPTHVVEVITVQAVICRLRPALAIILPQLLKDSISFDLRQYSPVILSGNLCRYTPLHFEATN